MEGMASRHRASELLARKHCREHGVPCPLCPALPWHLPTLRHSPLAQVVQAVAARGCRGAGASAAVVKGAHQPLEALLVHAGVGAGARGAGSTGAALRRHHLTATRQQRVAQGGTSAVVGMQCRAHSQVAHTASRCLMASSRTSGAVLHCTAAAATAAAAAKCMRARCSPGTNIRRVYSQPLQLVGILVLLVSHRGHDVAQAAAQALERGAALGG